MNHTLIERIISTIEKQRDAVANSKANTDVPMLDMDTWLCATHLRRRLCAMENPPACGTVSCIAGHAYILARAHNNIPEGVKNLNTILENVPAAFQMRLMTMMASSDLWVEELMGTCLFHSENWPQYLEDALNEAKVNRDYTRYCNVTIEAIKVWSKFFESITNQDMRDNRRRIEGEFRQLQKPITDYR